jgi:hypothetical protein
MLAIIDADTFLYYAVHQDLPYEGMRDYLDTNIKNVVEGAKADRYLIVLTNGSFRYNVSKSRNYKGNRKEVIKKPEFYALREYVIQNYKAICVDNMEADDLVILLQEASKEKTIVASPDKDVIRQSVYSFDYNSRTWAVNEKTKDEILYNIFHQMITGDSTDNIEGVHGIGQKGADKALKQSKNYPATTLSLFTDKYGVQDGMLRFMESYRLIYLLRDQKDVRRELGEEIPLKEYLENNVNILQPEEAKEDLW